MGKIFKLIADEALHAEDASFYTKCQACNEAGVPVYTCHGKLIDIPNSDVYAACCDCLNQRRIKHIDECFMDKLIDEYSDNPEEEKNTLRMTPRIPMHMQGTDWPLCCGKLTEFTGSPKDIKELIEIQKRSIFWERKPNPQEGCLAEEDGSPEVFDEVSEFRCFNCAKHYWVFQPT